MANKVYNKVKELAEKFIEIIGNSNELNFSSGIIGEEGNAINYVTRKPYRGVNILSLWISSLENNFVSNEWITFKQAQSNGLKIKKGSKSTPIFFYSMYEKKIEDEETGEIRIKKVPILKMYNVFNMEQIEGYIHNIHKQQNNSNSKNIDSDDIIKKIGKAIKVNIVSIEQKRAYYVSSMDKINMPKQNSFTSIDSYLHVGFHELSHATGSKERLNRKSLLAPNSDKNSYAYEELVAELSAAFLCSRFGVKGSLENHSAYLKNWADALKEDYKILLRASSDAQKASDFIIEKYEEASKMQ